MRAWLALLCALIGTLACGRDEPPAPRDLPREWTEAAIDAGTGGRYLPAGRDALRRLQEEALRSGEPVLHPQYAAPAAVALAIKRDFAAAGARRLALLLEHEADDAGLRLFALADAPPEVVAETLGLGPAGSRLEWLRAPGPDAAHVTFPFIRDYAPLVVARPRGDGFQAAELAVYRGPTLNKVVDAPRGLRIDRSREMTRYKLALTRALADAYGARLGALPTTQLSLRLDGGNLLSDGRGGCFATRILLAQNREDRPFVDRELARVGCRRVVYLAAPQRLDLIQHVDTLLYVADAENVVLSMPTHYESDRIAEFQNVRALLEAGYTLHRVPRQTASISYTNALTTRRNVYVPQYTRYRIESKRQAALDQRAEALEQSGRRELAAWYLGRPVETELVEGGAPLEQDNQRALEVFARLLPGRSVVPVDSDETNDIQGSWHCFTHEIPAL